MNKNMIHHYNRIKVLNTFINDGLTIIPPFEGVKIIIYDIKLTEYVMVYTNINVYRMSYKLYDHMMIHLRSVLKIFGVDDIPYLNYIPYDH